MFKTFTHVKYPKDFQQTSKKTGLNMMDIKVFPRQNKTLTFIKWGGVKFN